MKKFLTVESSSEKEDEQQKSMLLTEEMTPKQLVEIIEARDKAIRALTKKIVKLQKMQKSKDIKQQLMESIHVDESNGENIYISLIQKEIQKSDRLETLLANTFQRIEFLINNSNDQLAQSSMEIQKINLSDSSLQDVSLGSLPFSDESFKLAEQSCNKKVDALEAVFYMVRNKLGDLKKIVEKEQYNNKKLNAQLSKNKTKQIDVNLLIQLEEERKQRIGLKNLLQKSEMEKNKLINKITFISEKQIKVNSSKEELLQYSRELNYRIKDLQQEKKSLLNSSVKNKEFELEKYMNLFKEVKGIKEKSKLMRSVSISEA